HEEGDAADDARKVGGGDLAPCAHDVEDGEARGDRVGDLLYGRGSGLLQVVAADVGGVEGGDLFARPGDHVGREAHRRGGGKDVRPAREVLFDDVVLRRAAQRRA